MYRNIFKSFAPIKVKYCFLNIFHIYLTVIPDFMDIYVRQLYMDVNLTKDNMVTFIKIETSVP